MRTAARWFGLFLLILLIVGQLASLGMKEGWWAVVFTVCFIVALFGSLWYGLSGDED